MNDVVDDEKTIREELEAAMVDEPVNEPVEVSADDEVLAESVEDEPKGDRVRDEKGRFAKSEEPAVETEATQEAIEQTPDEAPYNWNADAKAKWADLPQEIRDTVLKREKDIQQFISKADEERQLGINMNKTLSPYMPMIQAEGGDAVTAVKDLLNTAYLLRQGTPEQKKQLFMQTAQQFGVDLSDLGPAEVPAGMEPLYQQINELKAQVSQQQSLLQRRDLEERNSLQSEIQQEVDAFAADPSHPHYESVKGRMAALMGSGQAKDLQDAYDQACWASPDIRATLQTQANAEAEAKRKAEAAEKAKQARLKGVSLDGGSSGQPASPAPEDLPLRQQLEAQFAAQSGAV